MLSRSHEAEEGSSSMSTRLVGLLVRPTSPPLWLGIVVALSFILAEMLLVNLLEELAPDMTFGVVFLLGVLVVSAGWGFGLAVTTTFVSAVVYAFVHLGADGHMFPITAEDWVAIIIFVPDRAVGQRTYGPGPIARRRSKSAPPGGRGKPR